MTSATTEINPKTKASDGTQKVANIIAVASGKGGVGKTWFSITLAHALAKQGEKVLLFDGDLGLANIDIQLGLMPDHDLGSLLAGQVSLAEAIMPHDETGCFVLAGRSGTGSLATLPLPRLQALQKTLVEAATKFDTIILDLGAGIDRTVMSLAAHAGTILVITNDEPTSITDAYAFIKLSLQETNKPDLRLVINMAKSPNDGQKTYETLRKATESFLKIKPPLLGIVRQDKRISETIRHQTPLLTRYPNADAAADVEKIAETLHQELPQRQGIKIQ